MLKETFEDEKLDERLEWFNEPNNWHINSRKNALVVKPNPETDFWQETHYGFSKDNGHFLNLDVENGFSMEADLDLHPKNQYDQAGLMIRNSPDSWIKASIEHEEREKDKLGAVVTRNGFSDWSIQDYSDELTDISFRIVGNGCDYEIYFRGREKRDWNQIRIAHLEGSRRTKCGLYACSPRREGFEAVFHRLQLK